MFMLGYSTCSDDSLNSTYSGIYFGDRDSSYGLKYVKPSQPRPPFIVLSSRALSFISYSKFMSKPSLLISASTKVIGGEISLFLRSSKLISWKNGCFLIYEAPLLKPSLFLGLIQNSYLSKLFASVDKSPGMGTGLEVMFLRIYCLFLE